MRKTRQIETDYYKFVNVNPHNKITSDCVVRAIARATEQDWCKVYDDLVEIGRKYGYMPNEETCYNKYLTKLGWVKMKEPRNVFNKKYMVKDWLDETMMNEGVPDRIVATVGSHHLSCIYDGRVNDIWDCSRQTMHSYWVKKNG